MYMMCKGQTIIKSLRQKNEQESIITLFSFDFKTRRFIAVSFPLPQFTILEGDRRSMYKVCLE